MNLGQFKKTGKLFGVLVVVGFLLLIAVFGGKQAATYFARASTCTATKIATNQVTSNTAVISWETSDVSQGRIDYGTSATNLSFSIPEGSSGKTHNAPLTLLTPNTVYYYLVTIGNSSCDSSGQSCSGATCVPFSFTTSTVAAQQQPVEAILSPTPAISPTVAASATTGPTRVTSPVPTTKSATTVTTVPSVTVVSSSAGPTSSLSAFCQNVPKNMGRNSTDTKTPAWSTISQYDIDGNGIINGQDIGKCQQSGK